MCFPYSTDTVAYWEILIEEHHKQFTQLYHIESIIPKMHFMVHFPDQSIKYGPLIHSWTMRHEAKLRIIKHAARVSNFKNVCQTVAKRHQHLLCYYIHSNLLLDNRPNVGPCKGYVCTENVKILLTRRNLLLHDPPWHTTSYVTINGVTYKPGAFILLQFDTFSPTFGNVTTLIKPRDHVILILQKYESKYYDSHYRAYFKKHFLQIT